MNTAVFADDATPQEAAYFDRLRPLAGSFARRSQIQRIAVVGNQPLGPSNERAKMIDSADLVFRVNGFRSDGDEPTVGTRTDIVVFNRGVRPTPWFFHDYARRLYLLIEPGRMYWENPKIPEFWPTGLGFITISNRQVIVPLNEAIGLGFPGDGLWATTGTTMLWIAARLFPRATIDLAGLSFVNAPDQTAWEHAFGDPSAVGSEHRIENESRLVRHWIAAGRVRFHH